MAKSTTTTEKVDSVYQQWEGLSPELKKEWDMIAPYGRSGVWYFMHTKGQRPGADKVKEDRVGLSPVDADKIPGSLRPNPDGEVKTGFKTPLKDEE